MTKILSNQDFGGSSRIVGLPEANADDQPATLGQLNAVVNGLKWKQSVRASTQGNINVAAPGDTHDGVTLANGDRLLVRAQSTASQNGIYVFNGASAPLTRSSDADSFDELEGAAVTIEEGTAEAGRQYRQSAVNGTIGADDILWTLVGSSAPAASESTAGILELATQAEANAGSDDARAMTPLKARSASWMVKKFADDFGDASNTQYDITHNLGTADVVCSLRFVASPNEFVQADVRVMDANTVRVNLAAAPGVDALRIVVLG